MDLPERVKLHRQPAMCSLRFLPPALLDFLALNSSDDKKDKVNRLVWGLGGSKCV